MPHRGVLRLVRGADFMELTPEEVFLQLAPISFDASTLEIWGPLVNGGRLVILPPGVPSLAEVGAAVERYRVSSLWLTAGLFHQMVEEELPALAGVRQLLAGGDVLSPAHVRRVLARQRMINGYGPTENTTFTACYPMATAAEVGEPVPVGRPIHCTRVVVVDPDGGPVPIGVAGEILAGGDGLARGYHRRPALTAERFVPDAHGRTAGARLYRTGDLGRYLADGRIEFLGRLDYQVKIRGFRVELGEIEVALSKHPAIREAVVVVREDRPGDQRLVAYVTAQPGSRPLPELRAELSRRLPAYMVPSAFVVLDGFPLNANGKVDRRALPPPGGESESGQVGVEPRTLEEETLAAIWREVLGLERVGIDDDFFAAGGHSLLATRVISRVRDAFGVELPVRALFEAPTVAALATRIKTAGTAAAAPAVRPLPRDGSVPLPLSFAQQRLWLLDQLAPRNPFYNLPVAIRLTGPLHVAALERTLNEIVWRHETLRTTFATADGEPVQRIHPAVPRRLPVVDLEALSAAVREHEARRLAREEADRPFDLAAGPLFRYALLRLAVAEYVLLLTQHHIISDGWSVGIFYRETAALYKAFKNAADAPSPLPELSVQYADFAVWQRQWLSGEVLAEQLAYWRALLGADPPALELPADRPRPAIQAFRGGMLPIRLGADLTDSLRSLSRQGGATLAMTLLAGFSTLLFRITGQEKILIGSPIAGRTRSEIEELIGFFVNTLTMVGDLSNPEKTTFRELLGRVREMALAAYGHQDLPFEKLVEELGLRRDLSRNPLFQVMFALQNAPMEFLELADLRLQPLASGFRSTHFDLEMHLREAPEGLAGVLTYDRDLFDLTTVRRLLARYQILLAAVAAAPETPLRELPWLSAAERHQLLAEWSATRAPDEIRDRSLTELFELRAQLTPEAVALVRGQEQVSYRELNRRANRLAHHLRRLGVGPEVAVGICLERSVALVAGLVGILKAGGFYVPLDPSYPPERLAFLLDDARASVLVSRSRLVAELPSHGARLLDPDTVRQADAGNPGRPARGQHLAYLIYTSGSTGRPKAVAVEHRNAVALLDWVGEAFPPARLGSVLASTSITFDLSVFELFAPLSCGGRVVLADDGLDLSALRCGGITLVNTVPAIMAELLKMQALPASVQVVNLAGEPLPGALVEEIYHHGTVDEVWNLYGPSEDTTYSTAARVPRLHKREPAIGRPVAAGRAWLLDRTGRPVALGVPGELCLGGAGLARGYFRRPALTAARFLPDPFSGEPGARLYRTGDLARYRGDGELEYLGRLDHQVKLRGFRIELGEIEAALAAHPAVAEAAVVILERASGATVVRESALVAFVSPASEAAEQMLGNAPEMVLAADLRQRLPEFMVPARFAVRKRLPLTAHGKVDRAALRRQALTPSAPGQTPRTPIERTVARVWQEVLELDRVGVHDNFFDLGGHSLNMVRVRETLRRLFACELTLVEMFQLPTVHALARRLGEPATAMAQPAPDLAAPTESTGSEIAVIAMAGRFPGAKNVDELWRNLKDGVESITFFSAEELSSGGIDPEQPGFFVHLPGSQTLSRSGFPGDVQSAFAERGYVRARGVLEDVELFDAAFFGFNPREAELTDPQHRIFLECSVEALQQAGYAAGGEQPVIGVFAGASENTYLLSALRSNPDLLEAGGEMQAAIGMGRDYLATQVSYKLNLRGPSLTIQTACSTSLVAVHQACRSLLAGECEVAVAGGVSVTVPARQGYLYEEGGILSPDGHCRAFDAAARGCVSGNGVGVVVLRRLADALAAGDPVRAVIRGSAINNDGGIKVGYTAPAVAGQAAVVRAAQRAAGVEPATVTYVEAHGTGTPLGDPIEIAALNQAFSGAPAGGCAVGSIKTNVGHLDAAAGVAGLIKTVLALEHQLLPPSLHFREPNPEIDLGAFRVQHTLAEWPAGPTQRRAGVSSFGIGGTNAHVVLEQAPAAGAVAPSRPWQVVCLSARTPTALEAATSELAGYLRERPDLSLADVAYTLAVGRRDFEHRRTVVGRDPSEVAAALESGKGFTHTPAAAEPPVVFLFPGQGAQYVNMGLALYREEPIFRREVDRCLELLRRRSDLDLRPVLYPRQGGGALEQTIHAQPALFAVEYALARLWMAWGVEPRLMIGHSVGEYVAACLAGVFSLEDALALVALRGRLMQAQPAGSMLAVPLPEAELEPFLERGLDLAAINTPALCVLSGPLPAIAAASEELAARGVECRPLRTSHAFHSAAMEPISKPFRQQVAAVPRQPPRIPWISNLSGARITAEEATSPDYWARHLRQPVRFSDGLAELGREPEQVLLEVGPGRTLGTLARRHPGVPAAQTCLASLPGATRKESDTAFLLTTLGRLWAADVNVDWPAFFGSQQRQRLPLPTYPFERRRYWLEAQAPQAGSRRRRTADLAEWFYVPSWKQCPVPETRRPATPGRALLFAADGGPGAQLARRLEERGFAVTVASPGGDFARLGKGRYQLDPRCGEHYSRLLRELAGDGGTVPGEIFHLWGLSEVAEELWEELQYRGFYSLLFLAQALGEWNHDAPVAIRVVTGPTWRITGEETVSPARATVLGLTHNLPAEYPGVHCLTVDVVPPAAGSPAEERLVNQLLAELEAGPSDQVVAWRGPFRWLRSWEAVPLPEASEDNPRLRPQGVYLITGGLGGIGLALAEHLARSVRARLILTGRSVPRPGEEDGWGEVTRKLEELEELGAELLVRRADVTDEAEMAAVLAEARQRFAAVDGVIHAAGIAGDGLIQRKTLGEASAVLAPKLRGTLVLEKLLQDQEPDFFLLCSSVSSELVVPGQADYCAANAFLDAFAQARADGNGKRLTVAVNWDSWREAGMAVAAVTGTRRLPPGERVDHPLLDVRLARGEEEDYRTRLETSRHWVVDEHRLGGPGLMPGTGYIELIRAAFEHTAHQAGMEIRDLILAVPLSVEDGGSREVRTTLRRQTEGFEVIVASRSVREPGWREHARGRVLPVPPQECRRHDLGQLCRQCRRESAADSSPQGPIRFGPRWQSLAMSWRFGDGCSLNHLELSPEFAGDLATWKLHPALLDGALAIASGDGVYLPFSFDRITVHGPLPPEIYSFIRYPQQGSGGDMTSVDLTVVDAEGRVVIEIEGYATRRSDDRPLPEPAADGDGDGLRRALEQGLTNREGAEVFRRVLGAGLSQVMVSTRDWQTRLEESRNLTVARLAEIARPAAAHDRPDLGIPFVAPRNQLEKTIAGIWQEVLGIARVGVEDDFLELGGHSLLATQVLSRLRQTLNVELPIRSFFEASTIAELSRAVEEHSDDGDGTPFVEIQEGTI